ncbi:methyltransferase-like protein 25B [Anser cygnoides]|uniref:methyltransferase-like protein 25B n=1 Tax=Anser cygnoides TaxID=8845 RepID=UPI0034D2C3A6
MTSTPSVTSGPPPGAAMPGPAHPALHWEQQRAADIVRLLAMYRPLLDACVIDFFAEGLWAQLPPAWQSALAAAPPPQLAATLLGTAAAPRAAWPLSLLAFAAAARALALPRGRPGGAPRPPCHSPRLHPLLRRHVKPKKQHEIRRLGKVLQRLSQATGCDRVVDVGAGQGHLSRFLAFGLGLSVTAVEGDGRLVGLAERFDRELLRELAKKRARGDGGGPLPPPRHPESSPRHPKPPPRRPRSRAPLCPCCPRHVAGRLDPRAPGEEFLLPPAPGPGPPARNPLRGAPGGERVLLTGLHACGDLSVALLRHFARSPHVAAVTSAACCYMKLSTRPQPQDPGPQPQNPGPQPQNPEPQPQNPEPQPQNPNPQPQNSSPQPQNPRPQPQNPNPQPQNPGPQLQDSSPQWQNPSPQPQNPGPWPQDPSPQWQNPSPQPQNPGPQLQNPGPQPQNPSPQPQNPGPQPQKPSPQPQNPGPHPHPQKPGPQLQNSSPQSPNPGPQSQNPSPQPQNPGPQPQNPSLQPQNPGPHPQNPNPHPQNPDPRPQNLGPQPRDPQPRDPQPPNPGPVAPEPVPEAPGYPLSAWVATLPGHELSYRAREAACHALEAFAGRLRRGSARLRAHCYRAALESLIRAAEPSKRHLGVQAGKKAHELSFPDYARLGLPRVGLDPARVPLDSGAVGAMLARQHEVLAFLSLVLLLAPLVESLILLDRLLYLREQGFQCALVPLFDPRFSPRNLVLVAARAPLDGVLEGLEEDSGEEEEEEEEGAGGAAQPPGQGRG